MRMMSLLCSAREERRQETGVRTQKLLLISCLAALSVGRAGAATTTSANPAAGDLLDQGYRAMYNLDFNAAHSAFQSWEKLHPKDPLGPVSDAAAYLFFEFDRLNILRLEFLTDD